MAYQAKRAKEYVQEFELVEEDGTVAHSMKVSLTPGDVVEKLSRQYTDLIRAQKETAEIAAGIKDHMILREAYEKLGHAVIAIVNSVFGEEQTNIIIEFYNNRYNDIVLEVLPFITEVVIPDVRKISQEKRKEILQKYNRKTRKAIKKGKRWDS